MTGSLFNVANVTCSISYKSYASTKSVFLSVTIASHHCESDLNVVLRLHTAITPSANVERVFLTFGLIQSKLRNQMSSTKAAKLVAIYKHLNSGSA